MKGGWVGEEMREEEKVKLAGGITTSERARPRDYDTTIQLGRQERLLLRAFLTGIGIGQAPWKLVAVSRAVPRVNLWSRQARAKQQPKAKMPEEKGSGALILRCQSPRPAAWTKAALQERRPSSPASRGIRPSGITTLWHYYSTKPRGRSKTVCQFISRLGAKEVWSMEAFDHTSCGGASNRKPHGLCGLYRNQGLMSPAFNPLSKSLGLARHV